MSEFKFACPICRQHIKSDSSASGTQIECPTCFKKIVVPQAPADTSSKFILSAAQVPTKRPATTLADAEAPGATPPRSHPLLWAGLAVVVVAGAAWAVVTLGGFKWHAGQAVGSATNVVAQASAAVTPDPRWRLDLEHAVIPTNPASGRIRGREFTLERATIQNGTLLLRQGRGGPPDVGVTILLPKLPPQDFAGKKFLITTNFSGQTPRVVLRTKDEQQPPRAENVTAGYALKLEFGQVTNRELPGRIYLCTPDVEKSVVVGSFAAEIRKPNPPMSPRKTNPQPAAVKPPPGR